MVRELKPTNCHFCGYLCAFTATVEDGRVVDLEPDVTRYPYDEKIVKGCRRWRMNLDVLEDEERINYPLRRTGERGSNEWERVSWDDALDDIAERLRALSKEHGPATLASAIGGPHASFWPLHRFMSLFGSPNNMGIGQICWNPRIWMDALTFGWTVEADIDPTLTEAVFIWGTNPAQSDNSAFWRSLIGISKSEVPLVVVDPRRTQVAARADLWLPIRPGTDCVLALGLIHVIVEEDLVDHDFVERWCHGYDELVEHVKPYTPKAVGRVCGLAPEDIERAARIFGGAGAAVLVSGRGVDQIGPDVSPTHRAICCLRAITGNVDKRGACVLAEMSDFTPEVDLEMSARMTDEQRAACLNTPYTPLQCYEGYERVRRLTEKLGRRLPVRYLTSAHPDLVLKAMIEGDPYPVRALIVEATNPLLTYADTHRVFKALMSLDLLVVLEYYMTPTASIADYVLPAAGAIERPTFQAHGGVANIAYGGPAAVDPYYGRKTDYDVFRELGLRLGQAEDWPDATLQEAYARTLAEAGVSWEDYCTTGLYWRPPAYEKHKLPGADGEPAGFATTTGKIELACEVLDALGGDRLPSPSPRFASLVTSCGLEGEEPATGASDGASPSGAADRNDGLVLITGARKQPYNASMFLANGDFRESYPDPLVEVSPRTAERLGLASGDRVTLSNEKGEASFILKTAPMRDDVVSADYGWWYPEREPGAPGFGGIWESNINTLTDCSVADGEAMIGTWSYNAIRCTIRKTDEPTA